MEGSLSATISAIFEAASHERSTTPALRRRRKLWEISPRYHCVVIGTCLSMPELRRLARRVGFDGWRSASDYALHRWAIGHCRERNELSRLMHREFERAYATTVKRFCATRDDGALRTLWKEAIAEGQTAGPLWALMTHPEAPEVMLEDATQELHMLSHQVGAACRADLRRLSRLERERAQLAERLAEQAAAHARQLATRDQRIAALERRIEAQAGEARRLQEAERRMRESEAPERISSLQRRLDAESLRARRAEEALGPARAWRARCVELEGTLAQCREELEAAERGLAALLSPAAGEDPQAEGASRLCGRCVVYVGGRSGMVEHYRAIVERLGGQFEHHDGGLEDAPRRLPPLLAGADAVVCAAGIVSHGAYYVVKRFCKQAGRPCVLLRRGSLSSFTSALQALSGGALDAPSTGTVLGAQRP